MRFLIRMTVALAVAVAGCMLLIPNVRHAVLERAGEILVAADGALEFHEQRLLPADLIAMDFESGPAGALALSDLFHASSGVTLGVLKRDPIPAEAELTKRGATLPDPALNALAQLGVPRDAIVVINAGEGGTTESTAALADWARSHPEKRIVVVVGASHGRRYRRALLRVWPASAPRPVVVTSPYGGFHAGDWWQSRETLREGLMEFEKLAVDVAAHPF